MTVVFPRGTTADRPSQTTFIDRQGHLWLCGVEDRFEQFWEYSLSAQTNNATLLFGVSGTIQQAGFPPKPTDWPLYRSFTFNPFTGVLFATFTSAASNFQIVSFGIVDLKTGKPSKVIATYPNNSGWRVICWGI